MKKIILSGVLLLLCGGCVIHWEDDNAAGAVKEYQRLLTAKAPETLNLAGAAALSPVQNRNLVRREFAKLRMAEILIPLYRESKQYDLFRQAVLDGETARINLNSLLGFHPQVKIAYDTAGAFEVPGELPTLENMEKAALISAGGQGNIPDILRRVHLAYAAAIAAYDAAAHAVTPEQHCIREGQRILRCLELTAAVGITYAELGNVNSMAGRFDAAEKSGQ